MSSSSSAPRGVLVAGLGAVAALASLWLPWYTIRIPDAFREALSGIGSGAAAGNGASGTANAAGEAFAGVFKGLAAVLPSEITGKGWQVMSGGDVALAVAAGAAILLVLALAGGLGSGVRIDRSLAGRLIALAGLVVTLIAAYHVVSKPGAGAGSFSGIATVKFGIWVATAGGLLMVAGGLMTARAPKAAVASEALPGDGTGFAPPVDVAPAVADPFAAPLEPASAVMADPFADPDAPVTAAAPEPYATPEPYVSPAAPEPYATPEPYVSPVAREPEPYAVPSASMDPAPYSAPDPFADPVEPAPATTPEPTPYPSSEPQSYAPLGTAGDDGTTVPDWTGFGASEAPSMPEAQVHAVAAPSAPRAAGVSIPPPGWTGTA